MSGDKYEYCKVYVDGAPDQSVMDLLSTTFAATFEHRSMVLPNVVIDVLRNDDRIPNPGDDFVRWPVLVEVDVHDGVRPVAIDTVTSVLRSLWDSGSSAVAACAFEDELPDSGGIQRLRH